MLGDQIREARLRRGLNQEDAAKLARVSRKQFWKLETGKGVTLETFRRVVTALDVPMVSLGNVEVVPGNIDIRRVVQACETAAEALNEVVKLLRVQLPAEAKPSSEDIDRILSSASKPRPVLTEDHPTVRMLRQIADDLSGGKAKKKE